MSPNVALFLCIIFVLFLFVIEYKQKSDVSFVILVPLIWYALVASRNVGHWLSMGTIVSGEVDYLRGSPIDRTVYLALILIGIFILLKRKIDLSQILKSNATIFVLFLFMLFSIFWSDYPTVSFKRLVRAFGAFVMVLVVLTESNPPEAISRLLRLCFFVHLPLSIILIKYFRTIGVGWDWDGNEMWVGVALSKNCLGQVAMTCAIYSIWNIMRNRGSKKIFIDVLFILMSILILIGSEDSISATSIFLSFFGFIILLFFHFWKSHLEYIQKYIAISIVLILFFCTIIYLSRGLPLILEASGRDATFTGRTLLWTDLLEIASHHPILGVGYGSFWIGDVSHNLWEKYPWRPWQGHNGYIDVYLELGLLGVCLLLGVIISTYKGIMKTLISNFEYGKFRIVFFIIILISNITESSFLRGTHNLWFLFLLAAVNIPAISRLHNSERI